MHALLLCGRSPLSLRPPPGQPPRAPLAFPPSRGGAVVRSRCSLGRGGFFRGAALRLSARSGPGAPAALWAPPHFPRLRPPTGPLPAMIVGRPPAEIATSVACLARPPWPLLSALIAVVRLVRPGPGQDRRPRPAAALAVLGCASIAASHRQAAAAPCCGFPSGRFVRVPGILACLAPQGRLGAASPFGLQIAPAAAPGRGCAAGLQLLRQLQGLPVIKAPGTDVPGADLYYVVTVMSRSGRIFRETRKISTLPP